MSNAEIHGRTIQLRRATRSPSRRLTRPTLVKELAPEGAAEANLALASDILELPSAFLVGKRRHIDELPPFWRWLARKVYFRTGWASDYGLECQAICTTEEMADQLIAEHPNWFKQELPINTPLPDEPCTFKLMTFPNSDAVEDYEKRRAPFVAVPSSDIENQARFESKLGELEECIEGKCVKAL